MRKQTGWIAAAALLLAVGCRCQEDAQTPGSPGAARAPAPPGVEVVEFSGGRVRLHVRDALQLAVLEELAAKAGFELAVAGVDPHRLSVKLDGVPLADAIATLLPEERYVLEYAFDRGAGAHVLAVLRVGDGNRASTVALAPAQPVAAPAAPRAEEPRAEAAETAELERDARERARTDRIDFHREQIARLSEDLRQADEHSALERRLRHDLSRERSDLQEELRRAIDDPDPGVRADAVRGLDTEGGDNLERVKALAHGDPDPSVRTAAAERLGEDGTFQAVKGLLDMLQDPEPEVLVATIEALDYAGDESLIPYVEPLVRHPDPGVREAASEVLDTWRW